jgi:hypothetical protein
MAFASLFSTAEGARPACAASSPIFIFVLLASTLETDLALDLKSALTFSILNATWQIYFGG